MSLQAYYFTTKDRENKVLVVSVILPCSVSQ